MQQAKADAPSTTETAPEQTTEDDDGDQQKRAKKAYDELNEHIRTLYQALPPRTALIIFSGHGDPRRMGELLSKKNKFDRLWKTVQPEQIAAEDKFMTAEDRELQEQVEKAKAGMAFFACK